MKWSYPVVALAAILLGVPSASAQTPEAQTSAAQAPAQTPSATVISWFGEATTGVAIAHRTGGEIAGEAGARVWKNLDASLEVGWFSDAANSQRAGLATPLTDYLTATTGQPASAKVTLPSLYGILNGRWVFEGQHRYRPYGLFGLGIARVSPHTKFNLNGTDITGSIDQYGVTLGNDLDGATTHFALNVGAGVLVPYGNWYGHAGYRLTTIFTDHGASPVNRINFGVGRRF
jgi:Outer membrane protein beta-barrel domain